MELSAYLKQSSVTARFENILNKSAGGFVATLVTLANGSERIKKCTPVSIVTAAVKAASLGLTIEESLGFAYIVPYWNKKINKFEAQFQIGYKGLIQLALRSGMLKKLNVVEIRKVIKANEFTEEFEFDFTVLESNPVGYAGYLELTNGFVKKIYWSVEKMKSHSAKYSKNSNTAYSLWTSDFHSMAKKTILRELLSKFSVLSIEYQSAFANESEPILALPKNKSLELPGKLPVIDITEDVKFAEMQNAPDPVEEKKPF